MAVKQVEVLVDDLSKTPDAVDTVVFGYGSCWYEVDVNAEHRDEFFAFFTRWVKAARPTTAFNQTVTVDWGKCKEFCRRRGIPIADGGRPSKQHIAAYVQAWADGTLDNDLR